VRKWAAMQVEALNYALRGIPQDRIRYHTCYSINMGPRLHDMHIKDLADMSARDSQVAVGEGKLPIPGIFRALQTIKYPYYVNLEYEINAKDPLPGMQVSFAYMRGALAGLAESSVAMAPAAKNAKTRTS